MGLSGVILHGLLKAAFLGQLVTAWAGRQATLKSFEVSYRGLDFPGRTCICRGAVRSVEGAVVEVDVWTEDPSGVRTTLGTATLEMNG